MSNPDPLTARSSPTMLPPGSAPIKKEFLDLNHIPKLSEHLPEDVKEQLKQESKDGSINTPDGEPVVKRPKLKGRNKKRPIEKNPEIESKFCPQTLAGKQCLFGDRCRFMHDVDEYMAKKPPDLGDTCHIYDTYGYCPYSFTCRFASRHITEDKKNMKNEELFERMKDGKGILNILDKEIQKKLWKKKYDFSLADSVWKRVKQFQDQNVAVTKNKPDNNTNSALKTEKLSCDDKPDMSDENTIQLGDEIPRESTDMLLGDCDQADGYEISYSAVSSKDQPLSDGQACQETEIANSSDVSIQKCESEEGVTGSDSMRQFTDMLRELNRNTTPKKKIDFHDKLYLAPLTTVGNLPFRRICKRFGADITCSEMALCTNLLQGKQSEWALLKRHESEDIFGAQLCGSFPDTMTRCAQVITDSVDVDFIDINCGCPIDLIFKKGEGCALMGRTGRFETIVRSMTSLMDIPLTVKLRTGIYEDKNIAHTLLPHLRDWGVSMVTLHGRSREQRYTRLANWQYIGECAKIASPMPLFGNGDILSYEDYLLHKKESGIAGVMIARGALIKPWIFTEIKEQRHWDISASERFDILRDFTNFGLEHWGSDQQGVTITRRFLLEWLSFLYRYIPVGLLERLPQRINEKPPYYFGRNDLETLMASPSCADWIKISEMLLGPVPDGFVFLPKHKASAYK